MKEFVDIHDFLVSEAVVGDWEGQEELVAEHLNEIYHTIYMLAEEDIEPTELTNLLELVWDNWIGQDILPELEADEIVEWCQNLLENRDKYLDEQF